MASAGPATTVEDLIEFAGLRDIAEEVGIVNSTPHEASAPSTFSAADSKKEPVMPAGASFSGKAACAQANRTDSPVRVHMPYGTGVGPAVPEGLADMVCGSSDGKDKKKRAQRAHGGKGGDKGLRHFSMKVCEKVEQKGRTTYNEVADELVAEFVNAGIVGSGDGEDGEVQYDEKNIRRRVYDALNVLMAMDIITKEKKQIQWRGLPTNTQQEEARMHMELASREDRLNKKRLHLQELLTQQISFKNLIKRNKTSAGSSNGGTNGTAAAGASSSSDAAAADRIPLPFIIVNSGKETVIDCEMAEDKQEIFFNFSAPFEIHDDNETLKRMRMQFCPVLSDIASMVPASLVQFTTTWQEQQQEIETRAGRPIPGSEAASWAVRPAAASS